MTQAFSRREFVAACGALAAFPASGQGGPARWSLPLNEDWLFEGHTPVTLPHCVARLSWKDWDPAVWEKIWHYRRRFSLPREFRGRRVFVQFDGVMVAATPQINGHALPEHLGGYLPFRYELTEWIRPGDNDLAVTVDSRWRNVPPEGSAKGPSSIDYLEPGGIYRPVSLCAVPPVFLSDVFGKPVSVLDAGRRVEVACTVDAASLPPGPVVVTAELRDGARVVSRARQTITLEKPGTTEVKLTLADLGSVALWDLDTPRLYDLVTTLSIQGKPGHDYRTRIGFREARFTVDGFFLNGRRVQLFGLNRHELYPYVGGAMPRRVLRRDAEILRHDYHCNIVRCSHYPQSEAFLDACDELGMMVWEEIPGWGYLGDAAWKELAVRDTGEMIRRDRNHPAIVIWGTRINESGNDQPLYRRTREVARELDDSRPTSGSMTPGSTRNWQQEWRQDVFAFDDYHSDPDGGVGIREPLPGVPYMLAEAVGQFNYAAGKQFDAKYLRTADIKLQVSQALRHAQAHDKGMGMPQCSGIIGWCAFDYGSLINASRAVKTPGVADVFRVPKLGASFYQSQVSPQVRAVLLPDFYWDFGPHMPAGPGPHAAIFSNCDRLELSLDGKHLVSLQPDRAAFPHLAYPPFFCDLTAPGELRIEGFVGARLAISRSFSADRGRDQFLFSTDDAELLADGSDATRLVFQVADRFGAPVPFAGGDVTLQLTGPGVIVGDNPFHLADSGGVGAVWVKTLPKRPGQIIVSATHSSLGTKSVTIRVRR